MDSIGLVDGSGQHVGVVAVVQRVEAGMLYGFMVSVPGSPVKNKLGFKIGRQAAIDTAIEMAESLGVVGTKENA